MTVFSEALAAELAKRRSRNARYSVGALARDAGVDASTMHQILKGERNVSVERMVPMLRRLGVDPTQAEAMVQLHLTGLPLPAGELERKTVTTEVPDELASSWLFYATLSALELRDAEDSVEWLAARLGVEPARMARILELIEGIGLVDRSQRPWRPKPVRLSTGRGGQSAALLAVHREHIDLARELVADPDKAATLGSAQADLADATADVSGMTFSVDMRRLPEALRMIRDFRRSLAEFLSGGGDAPPNDEVYRLNVQLFPLSRPAHGTAGRIPTRKSVSRSPPTST
jgi:DNA-binding MarR family transcriptional regulator